MFFVLPLTFRSDELIAFVVAPDVDVFPNRYNLAPASCTTDDEIDEGFGGEGDDEPVRCRKRANAL